MKKTLLVTLAFFILAIAAGLLSYAFSGSKGSMPVASSPTVTLPSAATTTPFTGSGAFGSGEPTIALTGMNGTVIVKDFLHNGETVADVVNPGSYILAGSLGYCLADGSCPSGAAVDDFSISYSANSQFFNVALLKEPLGLARADAETFLENRLGVSGTSLCALRYFVGVPYSVNAFYSGKNLGFSFCPGATTLPQ